MLAGLLLKKIFRGKPLLTTHHLIAQIRGLQKILRSMTSFKFLNTQLTLFFNARDLNFFHYFNNFAHKILHNKILYTIIIVQGWFGRRNVCSFVEPFPLFIQVIINCINYIKPYIYLQSCHVRVFVRHVNDPTTFLQCFIMNGLYLGSTDVCRREKGGSSRKQVERRWDRES